MTSLTLTIICTPAFEKALAGAFDLATELQHAKRQLLPGGMVKTSFAVPEAKTGRLHSLIAFTIPCALQTENEYCPN